MAHKCTVTAKIGPGAQATALVLDNITSINLDLLDKVMSVYRGNTFAGDADLVGVTTVTVSISGGNYTITVS